MSDAIVYRCADCDVEGVKLWREFNMFLDHQVLRCRSCAMLDQPGNEDAGDQIGWLIPAVPTVEMDTYWGFSSVPQDRVDWWKSLPDNDHAAQAHRLRTENASLLARLEQAEQERDEARDDLAETEEHLSNTQSNYMDAGAYAERMLNAFAQAESKIRRVRAEVVNQGNLGAMTRTAQEHILAILDEERARKAVTG